MWCLPRRSFQSRVISHWVEETASSLFVENLLGRFWNTPKIFVSFVHLPSLDHFILFFGDFFSSLPFKHSTILLESCGPLVLNSKNSVASPLSLSFLFLFNGCNIFLFLWGHLLQFLTMFHSTPIPASASWGSTLSLCFRIKFSRCLRSSVAVTVNSVHKDRPLNWWDLWQRDSVGSWDFHWENPNATICRFFFFL